MPTTFCLLLLILLELTAAGGNLVTAAHVAAGTSHRQSWCSWASLLAHLVQGLGELYEEEFLQAKRPTTDAVEERDAAVKAEARSLLKVGGSGSHRLQFLVVSSHPLVPCCFSPPTDAVEKQQRSTCHGHDQEVLTADAGPPCTRLCPAWLL